MTKVKGLGLGVVSD